MAPSLKDRDSDKVVCTLGGRTFTPSKGLKVCFLSDFICSGVTEHIPNVSAFVHPATVLPRSLARHTHHFDDIRGEALVVIHIGTNDVSRGVRPDMFVTLMTALTHEIQRDRQHTMYVAVSAVLPRPVDDDHTKKLIKQCNTQMAWRVSHMPNVVFLRSNSLFLRFGKVENHLFRKDGLHLNAEGKQKLFTYFKKFLWHFCRHRSVTVSVHTVDD